MDQTYDPRTARLLTALGVHNGSRVLLVAGGAGLRRWAAETVGATGVVVVAEPGRGLPEQTFDFVHGRMLLGGVRRRDRLLARMVTALAPGGALLVEEFDWCTYGPAAPDPAAAATMDIVRAHLRGVGIDPTLGRRLPRLLRDLGLNEVDAEGVVLTLRGATAPLDPAHRQFTSRALERLCTAGLLNPLTVKAFQERVGDPDYDVIAPTLMSVWGRRLMAAPTGK
ncbi:hypothetical protein [Nocardia sp. NPDC005998]|uniref:hypothetical protein n=1 Tax=Nocardia sp. NPDC005998 TaxID=3156894 RepID=UPI0033B89CCA